MASSTCLLFAENHIPETQHTVALPVLWALWGEKRAPKGMKHTGLDLDSPPLRNLTNQMYSTAPQ